MYKLVSHWQSKHAFSWYWHLSIVKPRYYSNFGALSKQLALKWGCSDCIAPIKDALSANIVCKREWGISKLSASLIKLTFFIVPQVQRSDMQSCWHFFFVGVFSVPPKNMKKKLVCSWVSLYYTVKRYNTARYLC